MPVSDAKPTVSEPQLKKSVPVDPPVTVRKARSTSTRQPLRGICRFDEVCAQPGTAWAGAAAANGSRPRMAAYVRITSEAVADRGRIAAHAR